MLSYSIVSSLIFYWSNFGKNTNSISCIFSHIPKMHQISQEHILITILYYVDLILK